MNNSEVTEISLLNQSSSYEEKHSNFLITINSNKTIPNENVLYEIKAITDLMINKDMAEDITRFLIFLGDDDGASKIDSFSIDYVSEYGMKKKGRRFHLHLLIKIKHRTKIRFNLVFLKKFILWYWKGFGIDNVYINIRIVSSTANILNYLNKGISRLIK